MSKIAIYIGAPNDSNGNPRRGWLIVDENGDWQDFLDEGYGGTSGLRTWTKYREIKTTPRIDVTPGYYREVKKMFARARSAGRAGRTCACKR
jgi:hypothetical protein